MWRSDDLFAPQSESIVVSQYSEVFLMTDERLFSASEVSAVVQSIL